VFGGALQEICEESEQPIPIILTESIDYLTQHAIKQQGTLAREREREGGRE
jgi:arginine decarboxylase-like protein